MSFDHNGVYYTFNKQLSQSLSSRAMSFDGIFVVLLLIKGLVLIPFEQGDVFRRVTLWLIQQIFKVLIPFEQGDVFRPWW